jgi:hypothetical protein
MKAFLWAVVACVVISVGAGFILTGQESNTHSSRTSSSVRLN